MEYLSVSVRYGIETYLSSSSVLPLLICAFPVHTGIVVSSMPCVFISSGPDYNAWTDLFHHLGKFRISGLSLFNAGHSSWPCLTLTFVVCSSFRVSSPPILSVSSTVLVLLELTDSLNISGVDNSRMIWQFFKFWNYGLKYANRCSNWFELPFWKPFFSSA